MPLYRILAGVHRCVAAHAAGLVEVRAQVDRGGALGPVELVSLADLYSPKPAIGRWDRGRDFAVLIGIMADPVLRDALAPVVVSIASPRAVKYLTPLAAVVVHPV